MDYFSNSGDLSIFPDEILVNIIKLSPELILGIYCKRIYAASIDASTAIVRDNTPLVLNGAIEHTLMRYHFGSRIRLHKWAATAEYSSGVIYGLHAVLKQKKTKVIFTYVGTRLVITRDIGLVVQQRPSQVLEVLHDEAKKRIVTADHTMFISTAGDVLTFHNTDIVRLYRGNVVHRVPRDSRSRDVKLFRKWLHQGLIYDGGVSKIINKRKHFHYLIARRH